MIANTIKPGHTSLDMADVSDDLKVEFHHVTKLDIDKRISRSMREPVDPAYYSEIIKADDVDLVAGLPADTMAQAIDKDHRDTVNNSMHFDGWTTDHFMLAADGACLGDKTTEVIQRYGQDLYDLRNDVYEIKHALEKRGLIQETNQRMGYNDIFRDEHKPYYKDLLGVNIRNSDSPSFAELSADPSIPNARRLHINSDLGKQLDVGDYVALYFVDTKNVEVHQINYIYADYEKISFTDTWDTAENDNAEKVKIYKSYGISRDGNFYFAKDVSITPSKTVYYTGFDDDTAASSLLQINLTSLGYATTLRVPAAKRGFLHDFSVIAEVKGSPSLVCYVIDAEDIKYFRNPTQAQKLYETQELDSTGEPKMHFFAKSVPVTLSTAASTKVTFDFYNSDIDGYPLLTREDDAVKGVVVRYCAIVCATYADENNAVKLYSIFDRDRDSIPSDLETRNTLYKYEQMTTTASDSALKSQTFINALDPSTVVGAEKLSNMDYQAYDEVLNSYDMYYEMTLREPVFDQMIPYNRGLYTARMRTSYPDGISHVRLMLRFAREGGRWNVEITDPGMYGSTTPNTNVKCVSLDRLTTDASLLGLNAESIKPLELRDPALASDTKLKPYTIIGTNITHGNSFSSKSVVIDDPVMLRPNDPVYRNAYTVSVKGRMYTYNEATSRWEISAQKKIYLKPVAVIKDTIYKNDTKYSDRVIYEGSFCDEEERDLMFFNWLEMQIIWECPSFDVNPDVRNLQMGIMHDLVFSTDRSVSDKIEMAVTGGGSST